MDITITLEDGGPNRWASEVLDAYFSDPDGDHLSYAVDSSDESVADAVISEPEPIMTVQARGGGRATITTIARDPGGLTATQSFRVLVNDEPDHSDSPAGATAIVLGESFQGRIDSPSDVDYFRLRLDSPGTLTIRTTGNTDPDIAVFDGAGIEVPGVSGSWIGSITREILDRGSELLVRFSGGDPGGEYTASATLDHSSNTAPDLEVGAASVSDRAPETGASFTLSASVRNAGDGDSAATTLRYYRSTDATISASDTEVGTETLAGLAPSGTSRGSLDLLAPSSPGTYYYGACVDAIANESDTTDNCSESVQVNVAAPKRPDLEVGAASVSDRAPETGASFTLSASVRNAGDGESAATRLRYYRSTDATIGASDAEVGTGTVAGLAPSGTSRGSLDLTAPSSPGTYYYGACVDAIADESDTTDNCSASVRVDVAAPRRPDLEVETPSVSDRAPETGASFTLSASVRNAGDGESAATRLRYYRSTDATISASDTEVGTETLAGLAPSGTSRGSLDLTAPSSPGTYYYGACVDTVAGESDTTDNCSSSVEIAALETRRRSSGQPDLEVGAPLVTDSAPETGASFSLSATVSNTGDGESPETTLRYYRSTDSTITTSDLLVGSDAVGALAASGTSGESVELTAPADAGSYYYGACVEAVTDESDTTNNCSASVKVDVAAPKQPDLEVGTPAVTDSAPETGASFTLSATVSNTGDGSSPETTLRYYRSTDSTITTSDLLVGSDAVGALAASGTSGESVELTAPADAGSYYYGACVEAVTDESDTTNNCSASVKVDVAAPKQPDLEVGTPAVTDSAPETGASFTLSATVSNTGDGSSPETTLRYYQSADATITTSDTEIGTDDVGALAASGTSDESVELTAPVDTGSYYYGACVDAVTDESDTTDNCSASVKVDVEEPPKYPDLEVGSPTVTDSAPETGASFTLSATVSNTGDGESPETTLRYYQSADATITTADTSVGTDAVGALSASGASDESVDLTAPPDPGSYYYGACVDTVTAESDTTNNCSASVKVDVEETPKYPDLEVGTPTVTDSAPETGASITLSATVSNTGDGESPETTLRYYQSADATITTADTSVGTDAIGPLSASGTSDESVELTAPADAGSYYYGACVDTVADESDTTNNCSASVTVTVQEFQQQQMGRPDLELGAPTVTDSAPETGASFTLSATVSNTGDGESPETTLRYYQSADATITTTDSEVGTDAVDAILASGTSDESVDLTAPSDPGSYYYGACVDTVTDESDTTNNCSASVKVDVEAPTYPDLEVGTPTVSDTNPQTGEQFTLSATVTNTGDGESPSTTLRYYQSSDATITTSDTEVGTDAVDILAASGTDDESMSPTAPSEVGAYYYGACVDPVAGESDTTNNCSASVKVDVKEPTPNLQVSRTDVDWTNPVKGETFTLSVTVWNLSRAESAATTLRYYRSTDATISTSDTSVGTDAVGALSAYGSSAESISLTASSTVGAYYFGACVDAVADESDTTDNCSESVQVDVVEPGRRVDISPRKLAFEALGDSETVTVRILDEDGDEDPDATFVWLGSSPVGAMVLHFRDGGWQSESHGGQSRQRDTHHSLG